MIESKSVRKLLTQPCYDYFNDEFISAFIHEKYLIILNQTDIQSNGKIKKYILFCKG